MAFEDELGAADRAYENFLTSNNIGDFTAAKTTLAATYQTVFADRDRIVRHHVSAWQIRNR